MSIANSYAKALYEAAKESRLSSEGLEQIENELGQFVACLDASRNLETALLGPIATVQEKTSLIRDLSTKLALSPLVSQFVILLVKKRRLPFLKEIKDSFSSVRVTMEGGIAGHLVSAEPIGEADISLLAKAFSRKLEKKVAFRVSTDSSLLAGMKVTVNGVTYDGTLRSQLQKLRDRFVTGLPGAHA